MRRRLSAKPRGTLRLMTWLLRTVLVAIVIQFSGVAHYVTDAVHALEGAALHQGADSCPYEDTGDDCPPGCPDCHCVHVGCVVPPSVPELVGAVDEGVAMSLPHSATGPPCTEMLSVFRPPRSLA